jgi:nucleoside-diphosphate-sugar epimerase
MSRLNAAGGPVVLVTGASGFVGQHLVKTLATRGYHVRILARRTSDLSPLEGITYERFEGDITDPLSLIAPASGVDYVYHVGGLIKARSDEEFIATNGDGTKNLCAVAKTHAPRLKRFLYVSSLSACGPGKDDRPIDEMSPPHPITPYGASKRLGEKWVQQFDFLWTIVRPPAVYGPGDRGMFEIFRVLAKHIRPMLGGDGQASVAFIDNLVDGIILAAERPEGVQQIFFLTDAQPCWRSELVRMIQSSLDTWAVPVRFPAWSVRLAARLTESFSVGFGKVPIFDTHKADELLAKNWVCNIDKARTLLGYEPAVTTAEGIRRTGQWYRQAGWL